MLDVGAMWLYDRQLRRVIPATTGQRSMAVLVGSTGPSNLNVSRGTMRKATSRRRRYLYRRDMTTWLPTPVTR